MKGLPLAYGKDMQEDKEPVFDAADAWALCARRDRRHGARHDARPRADARRAGAGFATATDLADWLVRVLGLPFRKAHHVTGRLVGARRGARASISPG